MNPQLPPAVEENEKDLWQTLGRIEAKLNLLVSLEPRIRALENWRSVLLGAYGLGMILLYVLVG